MKKILFSFLAVAALTSCAKTEVAYVEADSEIKLAPATSLATKADEPGYRGVIAGTTYPTSENFDVYGYWSADWKGNGAVVDYLLTDKTSGAEFKHENGTWAGITPYHWPKDGSLKFAAYSPASENFAHDYATDTYSKTGYVQPSETAKTWDLLFAKTTADYTSMTAAAGVPVMFEHALAWITLEVVAADATAAQAFDIKKVTINDVYTQADAAIAIADAIQAGEWSNHVAPAPYVVFQGSQAVTETATTIESTTAGTIVIPQAPTTVTINYDQNKLAGTAALKDQTIVLDLALEGDKVWEPGKHYKYYLIFGLDEILIRPTVELWEDTPNTEVEVDQIEGLVSSESQLLDALANGGDIVLARNITLTKPLCISEDVIVNLNGKTISADDIEGLINITNGADVSFVGNGKVISTTSGVGTKAAPVYALSVANGSSVEIVDGVTILAEDIPGGYVGAVYVADGASFEGSNSTIKTASKSGISAALTSYGDINLDNCDIIAYSDHTANAAGNDYGCTSRGIIIEDGNLTMTDCYVYGAHSGGVIKGNAIINGGIYEGYGHGGFYVSSGLNSVEIRNAEIKWASMQDGYYADNVAGTNNAGIYIGGSANVKLYIDKCNIYGKQQPIVLRDPSGNLNMSLYISNSTINKDYQNYGIRNDGSSKVYFGAGNNFNETDLRHNRNYEITGEVY